VCLVFLMNDVSVNINYIRLWLLTSRCDIVVDGTTPYNTQWARDGQVKSSQVKSSQVKSDLIDLIWLDLTWLGKIFQDPDLTWLDLEKFFKILTWLDLTWKDFFKTLTWLDLTWRIVLLTWLDLWLENIQFAQLWYQYSWTRYSHDFDVIETDEVYDKSRLRMVNHFLFIHVIIYMVFSFSSDQLERQISSLLKILNCWWLIVVEKFSKYHNSHQYFSSVRFR
jgi:hypothetical protein